MVSLILPLFFCIYLIIFFIWIRWTGCTFPSLFLALFILLVFCKKSLNNTIDELFISWYRFCFCWLIIIFYSSFLWKIRNERRNLTIIWKLPELINISFAKLVYYKRIASFDKKYERRKTPQFLHQLQVFQLHCFRAQHWWCTIFPL